MSKRIFIGLPLPQDLAEIIASWRKLPGRIIGPKNLHITLVPPWQEDNHRSIIALLEQVQSGQFFVRLRAVGPGPDPNRPRLIWTKGEAGEEVKSLKLKIESALHIQPEPRLFRLHVTLSRLHPGEEVSFPEATVDWKFLATEFVLFESHVSAAGADYEILARFPLHGQSAYG